MAICPRMHCGGLLIPDQLQDGPGWGVTFLVKAARCLLCARIYEWRETMVVEYGREVGHLANGLNVGGVYGRTRRVKRLYRRT